MELQNSNSTKPINTTQANDLSNYCSNWSWRAIECLVESKDFHPSPKWVAQRLNISVENVVDALEGLERLGIIAKSNETYIKPTNYSAINANHFTRENLLAFHASLAPQIITKLTPESKFTTCFLNADASLIGEYASKFMALYKELAEEGLRRNCKEIYASDISFAQLTIPQDNGAIL